MKLFLSYASEDKDVAEQVCLSLRAAHHRVFFDRDDLPPGDEYNERIHQAVRDCEAFIFLISPDSVANAAYTLTELKYARQKWPHPRGHVLPVMVRKTSFSTIPNYLKANTILEPEGNIAAEVGRQIATLRIPPRKNLFILLIFFMIVIGLCVIFFKYGILRPGQTPEEGSSGSLPAYKPPTPDIGTKILAPRYKNDCLYAGTILDIKQDQVQVRFDFGEEASVDKNNIYLYDTPLLSHLRPNVHVYVALESGRAWAPGQVKEISQGKQLISLDINAPCRGDKFHEWAMLGNIILRR